MTFIKNHIKILAGILILSLSVALFLWPSGDLNRAARLLDREEYAEAVLLLEPIARQRPNSRGVQLLYARALIGAGKLNKAGPILKGLTEGGVEEELGEIIGAYACKQVEFQEWRLAAEGWMWAVSQGWEPPFEEFQTHLAFASIFERSFEPDQVLEFVAKSLDASHPLAGLAIYLSELQLLTDGPEVIARGMDLLQETDWQAYGPQINEYVLMLEGYLHLALLARGYVEIGQGLEPSVIDALIFVAGEIMQSWPGEELISQAALIVWQAAVAGELNHTGSEAALLVSGGVEYPVQLKPYASHSWSGPPLGTGWSNDGQYFGTRLPAAESSSLKIIEGKTGEIVLDLPDCANFYWAPTGSFLLYLGNENKVYADPFAEPVYLNQLIEGWWFDNHVFDSHGLVYNLDQVQVGSKIRDIYPFDFNSSLSTSPAGLLLGRVGARFLVYEQSGELLANMKYFSTSPFWSPAGERLLHWEWFNGAIVSRDGVAAFQLSMGSEPQGWLDEERILVKRTLGQHSWFYIYTLATGQVQYLELSENPEHLYPAGDGETVAWFSQGTVYLGKLKFLD